MRCLVFSIGGLPGPSTVGATCRALAHCAWKPEGLREEQLMPQKACTVLFLCSNGSDSTREVGSHTPIRVSQRHYVRELQFPGCRNFVKTDPPGVYFGMRPGSMRGMKGNHEQLLPSCGCGRNCEDAWIFKKHEERFVPKGSATMRHGAMVAAI